jgi:hypothetical protein
VVATAFLCVVTSTLVCCNAPGKGPRAEVGYAQARRVIAALARYHERFGHYPERLDLLVPEYIDSRDLILRAAVNSEYPLEYRVADGGYQLAFRYSGPGVNDCEYTSASHEWKCDGHY